MANWHLGDHLSICSWTQGNQEKPVSRWSVAGPSGPCPLDPYKNVGKTSVLYILKMVSVLNFLKIVLLIVPINCKNFASFNSTSLENW